MDVKILEYERGPVAQLERYHGQETVAGYDDPTQLWELLNYLRDVLIVLINGEKYRITREAWAGLFTDKATTPGERSDWWPSQRAARWHDLDFTLHNLAQFEEHGDLGFRVSNLIFLEDIRWHIDLAATPTITTPVEELAKEIRKQEGIAMWRAKRRAKKRIRKSAMISPARAFFWRIRARVWYRAVNSIAGQGRYVNANPDRGNHQEKSKTTIEKIPA
jgi:hypothetical protein